MLLNAEQILAAEDKTVKKVAVPEWGQGARVLVGTMGALARARLDDWIETLGRSPKPPAPPEAASDEGQAAIDEVVTCDDPDPATDNQQPATGGQQPADAPVRPGEKEYSSEENTAVMVRWCAECILDPKTRRRAFTDDQIEALGTKSPAALLRVYRAALDVNLATKPAAEAFEKNSEGTSGADSGGD
jgi:hypothetical protein